MSEIGVSILCLAFNHEEYIRDAIEGFLSQKTTFPIEIIINEDCSTDNTAAIIHEYEVKHPDIIKPIYHKKNVYSQGININVEYMLPLASGKYVALCDGDDYWTDPYKLQKQYDALEASPSCNMCLHRVNDISVNRKYECSVLPKTEIETGVLSSEQLISILGNGDFFNEVCYFFRTDIYRHYQNHYPEFAKAFMKNKSDDVPMLLYFANCGDTYYISDVMATYRRFTNGSWSSRQAAENTQKQIQFYKNSVEAYQAYNQFTNNRFEKDVDKRILYFRFNYYRCCEDYGKMLSPEFDSVWEKQSRNYHKRINLLAKNPMLFKILFDLLDHMRH